jgi:alpha-L-fucosidase
VPPDRAGRIHAQDSASLVAFGAKTRAAFSRNLALGKPVRFAGSTHEISTATVTDGDLKTFQGFSKRSKTWRLEIDFQAIATFNTFLIREEIARGQRVSAFKIEIQEGENWREIARSTTIGARKILTFPDVNARRLRITILAAKAAPLLSEIEVYRVE